MRWCNSFAVSSTRRKAPMASSSKMEHQRTGMQCNVIWIMRACSWRSIKGPFDAQRPWQLMKKKNRRNSGYAFGEDIEDIRTSGSRQSIGRKQDRLAGLDNTRRPGTPSRPSIPPREICLLLQGQPVLRHFSYSLQASKAKS